MATINDDHMYHGAALTQIADFEKFKAINALRQVDARGAFRINDDIGIYVKHAVDHAKSVHKEYVFTFNQKALKDIETMGKHCTKVFIVFVCVKAKQICALRLAEFQKHIENRKEANDGDQEQYQILVTADPGDRFHVYVNAPNKKGKLLGKQIVARNAFPKIIFEK